MSVSKKELIIAAIVGAVLCELGYWVSYKIDSIGVAYLMGFFVFAFILVVVFCVAANAHARKIKSLDEKIRKSKATCDNAWCYYDSVFDEGKIYKD